jgi:hypothetical protein
MSSQRSGPRIAPTENLFASIRSSLVDAAKGEPFEREPIREMLQLVAILAGLVGLYGIFHVFWTSSPIHTGLVFIGYLTISIIALLGAWVVKQDG